MSLSLVDLVGVRSELTRIADLLEILVARSGTETSRNVFRTAYNDLGSINEAKVTYHSDEDDIRREMERDKYMAETGNHLRFDEDPPGVPNG